MSSNQVLVVHSIVDVLYAAIRGQILSGEIEPGAKLTELDVATRFSVARPTARAAVERLVDIGLLQRSVNKAARVPILQAEEIDDLYLSRRLIEREVVATLARGRAVPEESQHMVNELRMTMSSGRLNESVSSGIEFHRSLVNGLGSARISRMYESIIGEVHLAIAQVQGRHLLDPAKIADQHQEILDAIADGDENRAVEMITRHLDGAEDSLRRDATKHSEDRESAHE